MAEAYYLAIVCLLILSLYGIDARRREFFWLMFYLLLGRKARKELKIVKQFKADILSPKPA